MKHGSRKINKIGLLKIQSPQPIKKKFSYLMGRFEYFTINLNITLHSTSAPNKYFHWHAMHKTEENYFQFIKELKAILMLLTM